LPFTSNHLVVGRPTDAIDCIVNIIDPNGAPPERFARAAL
jgi:hypothetical protein